MLFIGLVIFLAYLDVSIVLMYKYKGLKITLKIINCKCTFSINTQVTCNHKLRIVDVVCHWPGSVHNARIFDNSVVKHRLEMRQLNSILLADSGYPCRNYILTPFLQPTLQQESLWNALFWSIEKLIPLLATEAALFIRLLLQYYTYLCNYT